MHDDYRRRAFLLEKLSTLKTHIDELHLSISTIPEETPVVREDLRFLDSLLSAIPDSIFFKDTHSRYLLVNNTCATLLDLSLPHQAYGKTDFDFLPHEYAQHTYLEEQRLMHSGIADINRNEIILKRDGTTSEVILTRVPVRSILGEVIGIVGVVRQTVSTARVSEKEGITDKRLQGVLAGSTNIISIVDSSAKIIYESPSAARILGRDTTFPRIGVNLFGYCHPADLKKLMDGFNQILREPGVIKKMTYRFRRTDGSWIPLESILRNLLEDPAIGGIIIDSREISDVQSVQDRTTIFEHVINSVTDSIIITDLRSNIIFINDAFCKTYGYTNEDIIGRNIGVLWSSKSQAMSYDTIVSDTLHGGLEGELYHKKKDGAELYVYLTASVVKDEAGSPIALTCVTRDITKNKQLEEQLRHSQKMESLGVLVGGIAHNFNNILGVIMGYASLLEEGESDHEKLSRNARIITEAAERGAHLVQQLMTYVKKSPVRFEPVSVNEAIEELTSMSKQTFPQTITFVHKFDARLPLINADSNQFKQVLFNIYLNARDAMQHGGIITVTSSIVKGSELKEKFSEARDSDYVCISISDTGGGMDEEIQNRIFDPFFTTKEIGKGVGLGLTMVYGMVESHFGFINVESAVDEGSTFRLYFPVQGFDQKDVSPGPETAQKSPYGYETIFVIEDEEPLRELLVGALRKTGYRVLAARDGVEALKLFEELREQIDLVVIDLGLPKLSGYDVLIRMRELDSEIKIIVASGFNDPDSQEPLNRIGVNYFLQKPYKRSTILNIIRTLLDK
jgi:two-component system, cell cycle sensor histidine kinase and response regulator CckA